MIAPEDWQYFKEWAEEGHYENGDWTRIDRVVKALINERESRSAKPDRARLSSTQQNLLGLLWRNGETPFRRESRTLKSLVKRGLVESRWQPPQPGNDYGWSTRYKLTEQGKQRYLEATK